MIPSENVAKCLGRNCEQAFFCWRFLIPDAGEGQNRANYDESRRMTGNQECEGFWPVVREPVRSKAKLVRQGILAAWVKRKGSGDTGVSGG